MGDKYLLPGIKCSSKANIPSSKHCLLYNKSVTTHCQIYDKTQNSIWSKALLNASDDMKFCVLSYKQRTRFSESWLIFQEIALITKFPGSNFLLPPFLTGGK